MSIQELSPYSLEHAIVSHDIVIVQFYASWCTACQAFKPVFDSAASHHPDVVFARINADREQELAREFEIKAVPTLIVFREKIMVFKEAGAPPPPILEDVIRQARTLDMGEVRRDLGILES